MAPPLNNKDLCPSPVFAMNEDVKYAVLSLYVGDMQGWANMGGGAMLEGCRIQTAVHHILHLVNHGNVVRFENEE